METLREKEMSRERKGESGQAIEKKEARFSFRSPRVYPLPGAAGQLGWKHEIGGSTLRSDLGGEP